MHVQCVKNTQFILNKKVAVSQKDGVHRLVGEQIPYSLYSLDVFPSDGLHETGLG